MVGLNTILIIFVLSLISGGLWRAGGSSWALPLKSKWRDVGCPIMAVFTMWPVYINIKLWPILLFIALSWGTIALSCDWWGSDDIEWYERAVSGFLQGIAALPIALYTGRWIGFVLRVAILTVFMPFSNKLQFKLFLDETDGVEFSRGVVFNVTIPLLVI